MSSILAQIFDHKRLEIARCRQAKPLESVLAQAQQAQPAVDFVAALRAASSERHSPALIAELKRASPSRGQLAPRLDPVSQAQVYRSNGAAAISVLTDERFFQGSLEDLIRVRQALSGAPLLRKDFICDPYQIYEARAAGADAVLLIVAGLEMRELIELYSQIVSLGMTPLVEVHTLDELRLALECQPILVGINNRDLHDFSVNLETTLRLRPYLPPEVCVISESGIRNREDIACLHHAGVDAVLVGEALVTAEDTAAAVRSLASC
jgi:indole-3-glycerol phosphate synthase